MFDPPMMNPDRIGRGVSADRPIEVESSADNSPKCAHCHYDLRGLREQRCPECGMVFDPSHDDSPPTPHPFVAFLYVLFCCLPVAFMGVVAAAVFPISLIVMIPLAGSASEINAGRLLAIVWLFWSLTLACGEKRPDWWSFGWAGIVFVLNAWWLLWMTDVAFSRPLQEAAFVAIPVTVSLLGMAGVIYLLIRAYRKRAWHWNLIAHLAGGVWLAFLAFPVVIFK